VDECQVIRGHYRFSVIGLHSFSTIANRSDVLVTEMSGICQKVLHFEKNGRSQRELVGRRIGVRFEWSAVWRLSSSC